MGKCSVCSNTYDKTFTVTTHNGSQYTFDSIECAIHALAPVCANCGIRIIGHGLEAEDRMFCCAHCAEARNVQGLQDRK